MLYWLNNRIVTADEAKISIRDISILRGFGIFDFFRTHHGKPFLVDDYLRRFVTSARLIGLPIQHSIDDLKAIVNDLIKVNQLPDVGIRMVLTGGESPNAYLPASPNFAILIEELHWPPKDWFTHGIKLITYPFQREFSQIKSTNYLTALLLRERVKNEGAMDVLYHDKEEIREVTRSNFFLIKNGSVITPDKNILYGVTREKVLQIARMHYHVEERTVMMSEIQQADECFITGTTKKIMAVVDIEGRLIGNGRPGTITLHLMKMFDEFEEGN